jgi:hypothetical protein
MKRYILSAVLATALLALFIANVVAIVPAAVTSQPVANAVCGIGKISLADLLKKGNGNAYGKVSYVVCGIGKISLADLLKGNNGNAFGYGKLR